MTGAEAIAIILAMFGVFGAGLFLGWTWHEAFINERRE